jgi:hypothetical protein
MSVTQGSSRFTAKAQSTVPHVDLLANLSSVIGFDANKLNADGISNTIFGYRAASRALAGDDSVVVGTLAAEYTQGSRNTYVGTKAGQLNEWGSDNVAVGFRAGGAASAGSENSFLGGESGIGASGSGNVYVGHRAGADRADSSSGNVAVGHSAAARGGAAIAVGAEALASAEDAVAVGRGAFVTGARTIGVGPGIVASGEGSLIIMPRRDGLPASFSQSEYLNLYGVLTGFRDERGVYNVRLGADREAVSIDDGSSRIAVGPHGVAMSSHCNVSFSCPVVAANGLRVAFGDSVFHGGTVHHGSVVHHGEAVHHGAATFNGRATFAAGIELAGDVSFEALGAGRLVADEASVQRLEVRESAEFGFGLELRSNLTVLGRTVLSNATVHELEAEQVEVDRLFVHGDLTSRSGTFQDLVVHGEAFLNASGLTLAGEMQVDNLAVKGLLASAGLASFNVVQVSDRVSTDVLSSSNFDNSGDARVGGDMSVGGALFADRFDCDYIECQTILVKGQNTLTVLGGSKLNVATANDVTTEYLTVTDTCTFSNYVVIGGDLRVERQVDAGSLVVRGRLDALGPLAATDAAVSGRLEAAGAFASAGRATFSGSLVVEDTATAFDVRTSAEFSAGLLADRVDADVGVFRRAEADAFAAGQVAASRFEAAAASVGDLVARAAAFSNLRAEGRSTFADALRIDAPRTGADSLSVGGSAVIVGDLTVHGKIVGFSEVNDRFTEDVFFQKSAFVGEDLSVVGVSTLIGGAQVHGDVVMSADIGHFGDLAHFGGPRTRVDGSLELGAAIVLSNAADPDRLSHWKVSLEPSGTRGEDARMKDFTVSSWLGTTFQVTEDFDPALLNFTGQHRCSMADGAEFGVGPRSGFGAGVLPAGVLPGMLVSASGTYRDLDGSRDISVDEAVPTVALTSRARDPTAFGVVSREEEPGPRRVYRLASVAFGSDKAAPGEAKVVVNSVGEGGMWVCDEGGPLSNGDLVCSSSTPGLGMRQGAGASSCGNGGDRDDVVRSYTAGKATCSCDFRTPPPGGRLMEYRRPDGTPGTAAFVGVTYKF